MKNIILSVGGSIIYPHHGINTQFLNDFNSYIRRKIKEDPEIRFFIMAGGGAVNREYQKAAEDIDPSVSSYDLDWIGVRSTRLNAHLLRTIFFDIARPSIIEHYNEMPRFGKEQVIICAGWYPGSSTDWALVLLAQNLNQSKIFSMINVDGLYDKDPRKFKNAKIINETTWSEYRSVIGDSWSPKLQLPFDPIAAKLAQSLHLTVYLIGGKDLNNFSKAIEDKKFRGTKITTREEVKEDI